MIHSKNYVTNLDEKCIQPNAVDLRLDTLSLIHPTPITITEDKKDFCERTPVKPSNGVFSISKGVYEFSTQHNVSIPENTAGWMIIRSTLARNGFLLGNGLYDAGYEGLIGGVLHVPCSVNLECGIRLAQFIMVSAEMDKMYDGHYNKTGGLSKQL